MNKLMKIAAVAAAALALLGSAAFAYAQTATPTAPTNAAGAPAAGQLPPDSGRHGGRGGGGGTVTAVTADTLTVKTLDGQTMTVTVGSATQVILIEGNQTGKLSDIKVGSEIHVGGPRGQNSANTAQQIMVEPTGDKAEGQVTAVDGATLTLTGRDGTTVKVTTSAATKYQGGPDQTTAPTSAAVGQFVRAYGVKASDGSVTARLVLVNDRPAGGPGGHGPEGQGGAPCAPNGQTGAPANGAPSAAPTAQP